MKDMSLLQLLLYALFLTVLFAWSATGHVALRADLTHIDSARGFTKRDLLRRMAARTRARVDKRWSPPRPRPQPGGGANDHAVTASATGSVSYDDDTVFQYLIHFDIGTPLPQHVALKLDTGSDLIWTQCDCEVCFEQPFPILDTSASASGTQHGVSCFDPLCARGGLPFSGCAVKDNFCFYVYSYGKNSVTAGKIYEDTFTIQAPSGKAVAVPSLRFGCGMYNKGIFNSSKLGTGIAGFGRGPMSLPSQLKVRRFSHCFTTIFESKPSPVFLGTPNNLEAQATGPIQSTPFAKGPNSSLYYLSLKGVTVGKKRLAIDASAFELKDDGSGGTIINSGKGITTFPRAVFRTIRDEFVKQVQLRFDDDESVVCFTTAPNQKAPAVPKLILHLEGADWDLPRESYVLDFPDNNATCVVIDSAGESDMTIIGNFQQQNMHIEYDLDNNKLSFVPARCDKL